MMGTERRIEERQQQLAEIIQEQQRIRENMASISQTSQYYTRLLSKLNDHERAIEKLEGELAQLKHAYDHQRNELETFLTNTTIR
jgi:chromosome segregation ATPase